MHHDIPELDSRGLRDFALLTSAILVGLFGLGLPWLLGFQFPIWPWVIAGILSLWGLIAPASLNKVYYLWMSFGLVLGWFSSRIILGILFYCVFTPMGIVMRIRGYDPMQQKPKDCSSYRIDAQPRSKNHMEKPF